MEKSEFRVLIRHCFLGKNTEQAKEQLDKRFSDSASSEVVVYRLYANFKRGRTDTNDAETSGHPTSAVVSENTKKLYKLFVADRKLKWREIVHDLKIPAEDILTVCTPQNNTHCKEI